MSDDAAWRQHWLREAVEANAMVSAVRELHQPELYGGLPTGKCAGCGEPYPCPTRRLVRRKPDSEPCRCSSKCPREQQ